MKKGFTLIELMIVIAILFIFTVIAIPPIVDIINKNDSKTIQQNQDKYQDQKDDRYY